LRELGVRISMDDFGTGYSSLSYLRKFPFDKIKIDQSFIRDLNDNPDSIAIVRAVVGLGSTLGITTTAEGVETQQQLRQLRSEGCTEVQGYLYSKPKPASELGPLLHNFSSGIAAVANF
jgi:EAL domain-containing protein (putative c-di-GMP-specific phosphodiesterase class I)